MDRQSFELQSEIFKALGHPLRIEIIASLASQELCFSDILELTGGLKSNLSQHLSLMVDKGILKSRKDSRCVYFRLASPKVSKTCLLVHQLLVENADSRKAALKKY